MKPQRIQLSRKRGWRMPDNTVSVARPGHWGNPYNVDVYGRARAISLFRETAAGRWSPDVVAGLDKALAKATHDAHCAWLKRIGGRPQERARSELRGRNLACWCPIGSECHADVLLELANS